MTALSERQAIATMLRAGIVPLEPYTSAVSKWRCRCSICGREIQPRYATIQQGGGGCLWCAGHRVDPDEATAAMQAAGLEPLEPFPGSNAIWRCRCTTCGREVLPRHANIKSGWGGCAWCAGQKVDPDEAVAVMRAAGLEPLEPFPGSNVPWRCSCTKCGKEVQPRFGGIRGGQGGCIWCAGRKVDPDEAVAVMRSAGLEPLEPYPGATTPWRCRCLNCQSEARPRYNGVQQGGGGCRACGKNVVDPDHAVAVMRAAGLEPLEPYPGSDIQWRCRCLTCDRDVTPRYNTVRKIGGGCIWCAGNRVDPDEAVAVMHSARLEPLEPYPGTAKPWRCRCTTCGREVLPRHANIRNGSGGCAWCAGNIVDPDEAVAVMRSAGLEPLEPYPGTAKPWRCRCTKCSREVQPRYGSIRRGQGGCVWCAGKRVDPDEAVAVMRAAGLEPLERYPGGQAKWRNQCRRCGSEVTPRYDTIRSGGSGCIHCAKQCPKSCLCRGSQAEVATHIGHARLL